MFNERLRMLREARGMSMRKVADDLQLPYTTYRNYENGRCEPNTELLVKLAAYYSISVDWLLNYSPKTESPPPESKWEALEKALEKLTENEVKEVWSYVRFLHWKRQQDRQG